MTLYSYATTEVKFVILNFVSFKTTNILLTADEWYCCNILKANKAYWKLGIIFAVRILEFGALFFHESYKNVGPQVHHSFMK